MFEDRNPRISRGRILNREICSYLERILPKLLRSILGVDTELIGFNKDNMVMVLPPKYSIASMIGKRKSQSASQMRRKLKWLKKVDGGEQIGWSTGYFVSSVKVDEETIRRYVKHQGRQDSGQLQMEL